MKIGDKVRIINPSSKFYGVLGEIITKGNGNNWQVEVIKGVGIYYFESELKKEKKNDRRKEKVIGKTS